MAEQDRDKDSNYRVPDPASVGPTYEDVLNYATDPEGVIDLMRLQSLEGRFGGRCDVKDGPCACGAWHHGSNNN